MLCINTVTYMYIYPMTQFHTPIISVSNPTDQEKKKLQENQKINTNTSLKSLLNTNKRVTEQKKGRKIGIGK